MLAADGTPSVDHFNISPPRSGNTWLAWSLDAHPSVSVARPPTPGPYKAPEIFRNRSDLPFVGLLSTYREGFQHAKAGDVLADFSTYQITDAVRAVPRILEHNPEACIITVLRDPVARLFDHYCSARRSNDPLLVPGTFEDALDVRGFLETSRYATHLAPWLDAFGKDRVHVILDQDLRTDPAATLAQTYAFLRVNHRFRPPGLDTEQDAFDAAPNDGRRRSKARAPEAYRSILRMRRRSATSPTLQTRTEAHLRRILEPEIATLETMLGRDLDMWRTSRPGTIDAGRLQPTLDTPQ